VSSHEFKRPRVAGTEKRDVKASFSDRRKAFEAEIRPPIRRKKQDDPLFDRPKNYHDDILKTVTNTTSEKLSAEVVELLVDPSLVDTCEREYTRSKDNESRLNELNQTCKGLEPRDEWTWNAADDTPQGRYYEPLMQPFVH